MSETRIVVMGLLPLVAGVVLVVGLGRPSVVASRAGVDASWTRGAGAGNTAASPGARYLGVVVSGYAAEIGSEFGGSVAQVWAEVGAQVREGQKLLQIDPRAAGEQIEVARAELSQQQSAVERARAELAEAGDLVERLASVSDGVSERALVAARAREEQAQAALAQAQAGLSMQRARLDQQRTVGDKHVIRAPFDGVLVARYVDPGDATAVGQILLRVSTQDRYVRFAAPPDVLDQRALGAPVTVHVSEGERIRAVLTEVQPEVDAAAQMVFARARLQIGEQAFAEVMPGARVEVAIDERAAAGKAAEAKRAEARLDADAGATQ